jgi:hypothetical protein
MRAVIVPFVNIRSAQLLRYRVRFDAKTMTDPGTNRARSSTGDRTLLRITWPFLLIVVVLVLLASESLKIMSATRAYVGAESLWSKAQKEAVYSLFRYAQSHAEPDYRAYRDAVAVPKGDRRARLELEKETPDLAVARDQLPGPNGHPYGPRYYLLHHGRNIPRPW